MEREIPFLLCGCVGDICVTYEKNTDITRSGFDLFDPDDFDPSVALGYPTMQAAVKRYAGSGYRLASGWIQLLYTEYRDAQGNPVLREAGIDGKSGDCPFFAYGYPSVIYDAPANNLREHAAMSWRAETFFVTLPARWNQFTVTSLCGFRWGYEDALTQIGRHAVEFHPLMLLSATDWERALPLLAQECPDYRFL